MVNPERGRKESKVKQPNCARSNVAYVFEVEVERMDWFGPMDYRR
jgi:hypothetical protein